MTDANLTICVALFTLALGAVIGVAFMLNLQRKAVAHVMGDLAQAVQNQGVAMQKLAAGLETVHANHSHLQEQVKTLSQIVLKQKKELDVLRHVVMDEETSRPRLAMLN